MHDSTPAERSSLLVVNNADEAARMAGHVRASSVGEGSMSGGMADVLEGFQEWTAREKAADWQEREVER